MSCTTKLNDILKAIKTADEKQPGNAKVASALKLYEKIKASTLEAKYLENVARITTNTEATTQEAINKMLETDEEYQELLKEQEAIEAGTQVAIDKYVKSAENRAEKGGLGAAESAAINIEKLEGYINDKEKLLLRLAAKRARETNATEKARIGSEIAFQKGKLNDYKTWLKESKAKKKASKARDTRAENLKEERNAQLEAKNEINELITEYENNFTTGGQLLARMRTNDRIVKKADSEANDFNINDYAKAKPTSTDIENMETRLAEGATETEGTKSKRSSNLQKASKIFKAIGIGLQSFIQTLDSTTAIHVGQQDRKGAVEGFQNITRLFMTHPGTDRKADRVLDPTVQKALALSITEWISTIAADSRAHNRHSDDAKRMLGLSTKDSIAWSARELLQNFDGTTDSAVAILGDMAWKHLGIKALPTTEDVNMEWIEAKLRNELGQLALKGAQESGLVILNDKRLNLKADEAGYSGNAADVNHDVVAIREKLEQGDFIEGYGVLAATLYGEKGVEDTYVSTFSLTHAGEEIDAKEKLDLSNLTANSIISANGASIMADVHEALGTMNNETAPYFIEGTNKTPRDQIKSQGVNKKVGEVSDIQKDAIEKQEDTAWTFNDAFVGLYDTIESEVGEQELLAMLGWVDPDSVHEVNKDATRGKNLSIERQAKYLKEARDLADMTPEGKMWFKWYVVTNGRFGIKSNTFNIQDQKLHRNSVQHKEVELNEGTEAEIEMKEQILISALSQSFDLGEDKQTMATTNKKFAKFSAELDAILVDHEAESLVAAYKHILKNVNEPEHAMLGLSEYVKYKIWKEGGRKGSFKTGLTLETDGITSGYILKMLQMPIFKGEDGKIDIAKLKAHLQKGGVQDFSVDENNNFGFWKEDKTNKDNYETPAETFGKKLDEATKPENLVFRLGKKRIAKIKESLGKKKLDYKDLRGRDKDNVDDIAATEKEHTKDIMALLGEDRMKKGIIDISRTFMKDPFMVFNYGSSLNSIVNSKAASIIDKIYEEMTKASKARESADAKAQDERDAKDPTTKEDVQEAEAITGAHLAKIAAAMRAAEYELPFEKDGSKDTAAQLEFVAKEITKLRQAYAKGPAALLEHELAPEMLTAIEAKAKNVIMKPLKQTFEEEYGEYIESAKIMNESMVLMMRAVMPKLEKAIDEKVDEVNKERSKEGKRPRPLTGREIDAIILDLREVFPVLNMPLGTEGKNKILLAAEEKGHYDTEHEYNIDAKGGFEGVKSRSQLYKLVEKYTSGAVIPIHNMDGSIQSRVLSVFAAMGVHDANLFTIDDAIAGTQEANKAVIELAKSYSLSEELVNSLHDTLNSMTVKEIDAMDAEYFREFAEKGLKQIITNPEGTIQAKGKAIGEISESFKEIVPRIYEAHSKGVPGETSTLHLVYLDEQKALEEGERDPNSEAIAHLIQVLNDKLEDDLPPTVASQYSLAKDLFETSEEGRYQLFNNNSQHIEQYGLEGGEFISKAEPYIKKTPANELSDVVKTYMKDKTTPMSQKEETKTSEKEVTISEKTKDKFADLDDVMNESGKSAMTQNEYYAREDVEQEIEALLKTVTEEELVAHLNSKLDPADEQWAVDDLDDLGRDGWTAPKSSVKPEKKVIKPTKKVEPDYNNLTPADKKWMEAYDKDRKLLKRITPTTAKKRARLTEKAKTPRVIKESRAEKLKAMSDVNIPIGMDTDEWAAQRKAFMKGEVDIDEKYKGTDEDIAEMDRIYAESGHEYGSDYTSSTFNPELDKITIPMAEELGVDMDPIIGAEVNKAKNKIKKDCKGS